MKLENLTEKSLIVLNAGYKTKEEALKDLIKKLYEASKISDEQGFFNDVMEREKTGALHLLRPGRPGPGATGVRLPPGIDPPCFCPGIFWRRHRPGTAKLPRPHPAQETDEDYRKLRGHRPPVHPGLCPAMGAGVRERRPVE